MTDKGTPVLIYPLVDLNRRSTLFKRLAVKIVFVRANLISFHVKNGRSFKREFLSRAGATYQPMVSNYTGFNFTGVEQFDGKVGDSLPDTLYKSGKSFAVYPRRGIGIGENAVLGERSD